MTSLIDQFSALSTFVICVACAVHILLFFILWVWSRRDLKRITAALGDFTRGLQHRSYLDSTEHMTDQVDAFLADVNEVLDSPARTTDRQALLQRMNTLDEKRKYLSSLLFSTCYNICRTMIEAYPLAGVLGTILAIGTALQGSTETAATVESIVTHFGEAIWSTFAGLTAAIVLMFVNSFLEPGFGRLAENRKHVHETVSRAKRELSMAVGEQS